MLLAALLLADAVIRPASTAAAPITIQVHNVRNNRGHVRVDVCPRARFLADGCPWHAAAPAQSGTTTITVPGVPPGDYAVQAFHDENDNDTIDRRIFGIPREGVGFSRDPHILFSAPKWESATFSHRSAAQTIGFSLRYFTGPGSPAEWEREHFNLGGH